MAWNKKNVCFTTLVTAFCVITAQHLHAQTKYWVKFKDKTGSPYSISNPSAFLSAKSIARRASQGISVDMTDIPVNQTYINQVNATGAVVFQRSKWFNAAIVIVSNGTQLAAINSLNCVASPASPVSRHHRSGTPDEVLPSSPATDRRIAAPASGYNYGPSISQVSQIQADCMHNKGYRGQNMVIAVIDDGFDNVNNNPVFDSLRNEGRILGTRDIVAGNTSVYEDDAHGAMVLSCMAGNSPGNLIGTAPKASYYLLRSEDVFSEKIIEENNWVVAAELADSLGADIITTSLGYTTFDNASQNHSYADLNGRTSVASIASTMAARKGIFLLNAAGNEGNSAWQYIGVPADADSILTVGSVNSSGIHSGFSSIGPTADGRIKPDVCTMGEGTYVCQPNGMFTAGNGTSFACPVMAGAVACLWQANPGKTNMEVLTAIRMSSSKNGNMDNNYGWGIPDMCLANSILTNNVSVKEQMRETMQLFPNPAQSQVTLKLNETPQRVVLSDVLGKPVSFRYVANSGEYIVILAPEMAPGLYLISVYTSQGMHQARLVKE